VRPGKVVVLGGGIAGGNSCQIAVGMGAQVSVIERNPNRLRYLHDVLGGQLTTLMSNRANIEEEVREAVLQELRANFKPEFLNRIDDIVIFHQLSRDQIGQIIDVQLERLLAMLAERNIQLVLDDSARQLLAREGYDPNYGARPLKRAIQTLIQNPLAVKLLNGEVLPGQRVKVTAKGDQMDLKVEAAAAAA